MHQSLPAPLLGLALALALTAPLPTAFAAPPIGTAALDIRVEGQKVLVTLKAAAETLIGFSGAPVDTAQRDDLRLAAANLKRGDALIRFNTQASCQLEQARIDADPRKGRDGTEMGATYRFHCLFPQSLGSAVAGLFMGFNALARVEVHYVIPAGQGVAVLTRANPVVSFVPLLPATSQ
jgi:hypothetical protein